MTEEETYATPKIMLVFAIVATCLFSVYTFYALLGAYNDQPILVTTWSVIIYLSIPLFLFLEVAKKKKKIHERWARYIEATLFVVVCILLFGSYLLLR